MNLSNHSIRMLDLHRDLDQVAELIETCFRDHLDADGYQYIYEIRRAARQRSFIQFIPGARERVSVPIYGYVYEFNGKVIGNLSLIPFRRQKKWIYLIANVAVHPDFQHRGIGKQLTQKALQHIYERGVSAAWLQVREDNDIAIHLYQSIGFREVTRRTNWLSLDHKTPMQSLPPAIKITQQLGNVEIWQKQLTWLDNLYPQEIAWYLSFNRESFQPTIWRQAWNILNGSRREQWAAYQNGNLIGTATLEPTHRSADVIWLATDESGEDLAIRCLLSQMKQQMSYHRRLMVNYPARRAKNSFLESGFEEHNTLIWMKVDFETTDPKIRINQ